MSDPLIPDPREVRPPVNVNVLRSRVDDYARVHGLDVARLYQRVYTELTIGVLDHARDLGVIPGYLVKGGMALELRFGMRARASGDLDLAIPGDDVLALLDAALAVGFGDFTFERRAGTRHLENARTFRVSVKLLYRGRAFGTIDIDLNQALAETAADEVTTSVITQFGLPGPLLVPLLDTYTQLAHKLHAATEPSRADYTNTRFRDILDALVLARAGGLDYANLRSVAIAEFARRTHNTVWPPVWRLPAEWNAALQAEARRHNFEPTDPSELEREFLALIARIEGVNVNPRYEYRIVTLQEVISGGNPGLAPEGLKILDEYVNDGWRAIFMAPHRHYADLLEAIFERKIPSVDDLPRLQLRVRTELATGQAHLQGQLRNESDRAANQVRVFASGVDEVKRFGTITRGDGAIDFLLRYDHAALRNGPVQFPTLFVEYLTDDGVKVLQRSALRSNGVDASGRYAYEGLGLEPPEYIDGFQHPHDSDEQ